MRTIGFPNGGVATFPFSRMSYSRFELLSDFIYALSSSRPSPIAVLDFF
jgi:hypothetical protein